VNITAFDKNVLGLIERELALAVDMVAVSAQLSRGVSYSIFPAGKRIRPLLALALNCDLGGQIENLLPAAVALELVHCASLVHDDLPALDDDDMRRGQPSCHRALGEATAILTGDVLVPIAFRFVAGAPLADSTKVKLTAALAEGYAAVCAGQQLDLAGASNLTALQTVHACKTGALFAAATCFGVIGAGRLELEESAAELGHQIGLSFQILDDYLDVRGDPAERGRPSGSDARKAKNTFMTLDAEGARATYREARTRTADLLRQLHGEGCPRTTVLLDRLFSGARL